MSGSIVKANTVIVKLMYTDTTSITVLSSDNAIINLVIGEIKYVLCIYIIMQPSSIQV